MEARTDIMTDTQWRGMLHMVLKIVEKCASKEEILSAIKELLEEKYEAEKKD